MWLDLHHISRAMDNAAKNARLRSKQKYQRRIKLEEVRAKNSDGSGRLLVVSMDTIRRALEDQITSKQLIRNDVYNNQYLFHF